MVLKIGVTGGIGSGKSTLCKVFSILGIPVFEADTVAKKLINEHPQIKKGLVQLFGDEIYANDGTLNRKKLADYIFNDDVQLEKVNKLVHPLVRDEFSNWGKLQDTPYIVHEAAILFESGFYKMMDFTILITSPKKERISRVVKRDGILVEQVKDRMAKQWPDSKKRELASIEIENNNKKLIIPEIIKIDKNLRTNGKIW